MIKPESISQLLILLGAGIWLGGFIMLGYGVAPVNFGVAEAWQLEGENPRMPEQNVSYRTIGGELTGNSIARLNQIESICLFLIVIGLAVSWNAKSGSRKNRIVRTLLVALIAGLFYYYAVHVGGRLMEIRNTVPLDFSITENTLKSAGQLEFDRLHKTYTRVASIAMFGLLTLFGLTIFEGQSEK